MAHDQLVKKFMADIIAKNPGEVEFHQAVQEVAESLLPFIEENPKYKHDKTNFNHRQPCSCRMHYCAGNYKISSVTRRIGKAL
jgi:hypothetical protein